MMFPFLFFLIHQPLNAKTVISEQLATSLNKTLSQLIKISYIKDTTVKLSINPAASRQDGKVGQCKNFNILV